MGGHAHKGGGVSHTPGYAQAGAQVRTYVRTNTLRQPGDMHIALGGGHSQASTHARTQRHTRRSRQDTHTHTRPQRHADLLRKESWISKVWNSTLCSSRASTRVSVCWCVARPAHACEGHDVCVSSTCGPGDADLLLATYVHICPHTYIHTYIPTSIHARVGLWVYCPPHVRVRRPWRVCQQHV
jgi:hypothetical protein